MKTNNIILVFLFFLSAINFSFAQAKEKVYLALSLYIEEGKNNNLLRDADVEVKRVKDGKVIAQEKTGGALVNFELSFNYEYLISISKYNYVTKVIAVSTKIPNQKTNNQYARTVRIGLYEKIQLGDIGAEILNKPVLKVYFDEKEGEFIYDEKYANDIKNEIAKLSKQEKNKLIEKVNAKAKGIDLDSIANARKVAEAKAESDRLQKEADAEAKAEAKAEAEWLQKEAEEKADAEAEQKAAAEAKRLKDEVEAKRLKENREAKKEVVEKVEEAVAESELNKKQETSVSQTEVEHLKKEADDKAILEQIAAKEEEKVQTDVKAKKVAAQDREVKYNKRIKYEHNNPYQQMLREAAQFEIDHKKRK